MSFKKFFWLIAVLCIAVITLCSIAVVQKLAGRTRLDLTEHHIYTLSEGTRNILAELNQPLELKLYYARVAAMKGPEGIRFFNNYYLYVRDILEEFVNLSGGKLKLEVIDPRPYSDEEEDARNYGIRQIPISEDENFYFGLVAESELGKSQEIDLFQPDRQEFVEYDIARLISNVAGTERKKIGVISSLDVAPPEMSDYLAQMLRAQGRDVPEPWIFISHLRDEYDVEAVSPGREKIDDGYDFLLVVHPKSLDDKTLFAIDQYVMGGGKLIVLVDPLCLVDRPQRDPENPYAAMMHRPASNLNELLKNWGVEMDDNVFAVDQALGITASFTQLSQPEKHITFLNLDDECVNKEEVISADLHSITMLFAGALRRNEKAGTEVTPLLTTTATGVAWKSTLPMQTMLTDPEEVAESAGEGSEPVMLACLIHGPLKSNFPNGLPKSEASENETEQEGAADSEGQAADDGGNGTEDKAETGTTQALKESSPEAAVVVVADVDFISDQLAYASTLTGIYQRGNNASFLFNVLDYLGGSQDLISIRSRGKYRRPFKTLDDLETKVEKEMKAKEKEIDTKISQFNKELEELGAKANEKNLSLIQSTAVEKYRELQKSRDEAENEKRKLKANKRERIEALGDTIKIIDMLAAPVVVLLIAVSLAVYRYIKARRYAERRA